MSDHLDRLMRKVDMLEQDNKRLFERLARAEKAIEELRLAVHHPLYVSPPQITRPGFLDD